MNQSVLVVGAGVAGLTVARRLKAAGVDVAVIDKGRGPGGRLSTRREGDLRFDHGAQYLTARDPAFAVEVAGWEAAGAVARWSPRLATLADGRAVPKASDTPRFVGVPGMSAVCKHLAQGLNVTYSCRATRVAREGGAVRVSATMDDGSNAERTLEAARVVVAVPDVQARQLLGGHLELPASVTEPCWAAMAAFESMVTDAFDAGWAEGSPLRWVARESSKPGRPSGEAWVLHASPEWSREHLELTPDEVAPRLLEAFRTLAGGSLPGVTFAKAHRWRFALTTTPAGTPFVATADHAVSACGDYLLGGKIEAAFLSGLRLAERLTA